MKPFDINKAKTVQVLTEDNEVLASYSIEDGKDSHAIMLFMTNEKYTGCISNARLIEILDVHSAILNILEDRGIDADALEMLKSLTESKSKSDSFNVFMNRMMNS